MVEYYYDPTTGRFISIDDTKYLDFEVAYGYNRYAYCNNNPVMGYDPEGGPNGEYTVWQMVMAIMGSIGMIGSFIGVIISLCGAPQIGVPVWAIGGAIGTLFFALGGFLF